MDATIIGSVRGSERSPALLTNNAGIHVFVLLYAVAGMLVSYTVGRPDKFTPFIRMLSAMAGLMGAAIVLGGLWALKTGQPFASLRRIAARARQPQGISALLLVLALCLHFGVFVSIKTQMTDINPFYADRLLADWDEAIHGIPPWQVTQAIIPASFTTLCCVLYFGVWLVLWNVSLLACILSPHLKEVRAQYLWSYLLAFPLLGNVFAVAGMSAGPVYYGAVTGDVTRFAELSSFLERWLPEVAAQGVSDLWRAYASAEPTLAGAISAFPSMHLAVATLLALFGLRINPWAGLAGIIYCGIILVLSVHLGWHYAIDGYVSIAATVIIWKAVGWVLAAPPLPQVRRREVSGAKATRGSVDSGQQSGAAGQAGVEVGCMAGGCNCTL